MWAWIVENGPTVISGALAAVGWWKSARKEREKQATKDAWESALEELRDLAEEIDPRVEEWGERLDSAWPQYMRSSSHRMAPER